MRGAARITALAAALGLWALLLDGGLVRHRALAGPLAIARAAWSSLRDGTLLADALASVGRTLAGVALGALVAVPLGLWAGRARRDGEPRGGGAVEQGLDFFRAIPPLLVLPLALLAFGYGEATRIGVIAWAAALTMSLHLAAAAAHPSTERDRALRAMGASRWQRLRWVQLPELVPPSLTALRQGLSFGLVVSVVTEMVMGVEHGLGARAVAAQIAYDTPSLYAVLLVAGTLGWLASRSILTLEGRVAAWRTPS